MRLKGFKQIANVSNSYYTIITRAYNKKSHFPGLSDDEISSMSFEEKLNVKRDMRKFNLDKESLDDSNPRLTQLNERFSFALGNIEFTMVEYATARAYQNPSIWVRTGRDYPNYKVLGGGGFVHNSSGSVRLSSAFYHTIESNPEYNYWEVEAHNDGNNDTSRLTSFCMLARMRDDTAIPDQYYKIVTEYEEGQSGRDYDRSLSILPPRTSDPRFSWKLVGGGGGVIVSGAPRHQFLTSSHPYIGGNGIGWYASARNNTQNTIGLAYSQAIALNERFLYNQNVEIINPREGDYSPTGPNPEGEIVTYSQRIRFLVGGAAVGPRYAKVFLTNSYPVSEIKWAAQAKRYGTDSRSRIRLFGIPVADRRYPLNEKEIEASEDKEDVVPKDNAPK